MTSIGHSTNLGARRRHTHAAPTLLAGATAIATFALFSAAPGGDTSLIGAQHVQALASARVIAVDDGGVNDQGQTSGDIFTQNAHDQSTASGAGTP